MTWRNNRRGHSLIVLAAVFALLLPACGGVTDSGSGSATQSEAPATEPARDRDRDRDREDEACEPEQDRDRDRDRDRDCDEDAAKDRDRDRGSAQHRRLVTVRVFFPNSERSDDCAAVYPLRRRVRPPAVATNALRHLLRGPTPDERSRGFGGWFGPETAGTLNGVEVRNRTAFVDFQDFSTIIPNASASCGSTMLLAQLDRTLLQFPTIDDTRYSFDGDADAFYEWLQMSAP